MKPSHPVSPRDKTNTGEPDLPTSFDTAKQLADLQKGGEPSCAGITTYPGQTEEEEAAESIESGLRLAGGVGEGWGGGRGEGKDFHGLSHRSAKTPAQPGPGRSRCFQKVGGRLQPGCPPGPSLIIRRR